MDYQNDGWLVSIFLSFSFYREGEHKALGFPVERKEYIWPGNFSGICPGFFLNTFLNYRRGGFYCDGKYVRSVCYLVVLVNDVTG